MGQYIGSWILTLNIWDGAEMGQPLTVLDGKCSVRYWSVYTYERCLFFSSMWESGAGSILAGWAKCTRVRRPRVCCMMLSTKWRTVVGLERECHWAKKASSEQTVKWGSLRKLNLVKSRAKGPEILAWRAEWPSKRRTALHSFHRCGGRGHTQRHTPGARHL